MKNKLWNENEKNLIFSLRKNNISIPEIINTLKKKMGKKFPVKKITKIRIYNSIRISRKRFKDCCFRCGKKLTIEDKKSYREGSIEFLCLKCKKYVSEYKKELRRKAMKRGLCGTCQKNKALFGYAVCRFCLSATYRRRIKSGLCGICGLKPLSKDSISQCDKCLEKNRKQYHLY